MTFAKAGLLSVGTELTTGQTENTNVSWISRQLVMLGVNPRVHVVVADDRPEILAALRTISAGSDLLIVTGGLGPTADDFTREVISDFCGRELEFDQVAWKLVSERLSKFGIRVAESNRQQCRFPKGSRVLPNPAGTAAGFHVPATANYPDILVLPGPPREVEAVWNGGLGAWISGRSAGPKRNLLTWQCLGKSEAELGEIVEKALDGSGFETGYRAHRPYVEIKVWTPMELTPDQKLRLRELSTAIGTWCVQWPGEQTPLERFLAAVVSSGSALLIEDFGSAAILAERVGPAIRRQKALSSWSLVSGTRPPDQEQQKLESGMGVGLQLRLTEILPGQSWTVRLIRCAAGLRHERSETLESPFQVTGPTEPVRDMMQERVLRWAAEAAIVWATRVLESGTF